MQMHESKNLKAHITKGRGSFITKLLEIMKKYPDTIGWTPDGKRLVIRNIRDMEQNIINKYYRHRNINSFVRQLNMYYFRKLETEDKNQMLFQNENFTQGNDDNFHLIQRRNKKRDQIIDGIHNKFQAIMKNIEESQELSPETKNMVIAAIQYQQVLAENLKKIKQNLKGLNSHMKKSRGKQVKEALQEMRKSEEYLQQLLEMGKEIEEFVQDKLKSELRQSNQAKNNPMVSEYNYDGERKRMFSLNSQPGGNRPFPSYNSNFSLVNNFQSEEESSFIKKMMKNPKQQNDENVKQEQSEMSQNEKQSE